MSTSWPNPSSRWNKHKFTISLGIALLAVAVLFYAIFFKSASSGFEAGIGKVERGDLLQRTTISGTIIPNRKTLITAPYSGYVRKIFVKLGDVVKPQDPVATISQSLQSAETSFPLRAPFGGVVVDVPKTEGEYVKENDSTGFILRIDDLSKYFISATVPEMDRTKIRAGMEAIVKPSAILDRTYKAVIREVSRSAKEYSSGSRSSQVEYPVRLEILNPDEDLQPGMSVVIDIITQKKENVLKLRHEFIHQEEGRYFVELNNGKEQDVKLGLQNEEAAEITDGLKENDQVRQIDFSSLIKGN